MEIVLRDRVLKMPSQASTPASNGSTGSTRQSAPGLEECGLVKLALPPGDALEGVVGPHGGPRQHQGGECQDRDQLEIRDLRNRRLAP